MPGFNQVVAAVLAAASLACGQPANHVYTDDSLVATDTLPRAAELLASGNHAEAARALHRLLEDEGDRVIVSTSDPDLYDSVRTRVHAAILASPELTDEYRLQFSAPAEAALRSGEYERVESAYLLTAAGFEAALRLAQVHLEAGRFEAARLVLGQLESHPDRVGQLAADAAGLLALLARYINRPEVWDTAERWSADAGSPAPAREPFARPPVLQHPVYSPLLGGVAPPRAGVPTRPLWTRELGAESDDSRSLSRGPAAQGAVPARPPSALWIYPAIVGDALVVSDGVAIRGFDRFTLEQRWQARPTPAPGIEQDTGEVIRQQRNQRALQFSIEDASTVTIAGPLALSVTGLAQGGERQGDPRLHAVEIDSGRVRWSVLVSLVDLRLRHSSVRGPVLAEADTVVVSLRKSVPTQRIISHYLVGLDLWTGAARWVRHVGSAGSLPYQRDRRMADTPALDRGVVYAADQIGVCGAFDAHSGRPLWVRRTPSIELGSTQPSVSTPWESNGPAVFDHAIALLGADHRDILLLDRDTGEILARRSADAFGDPWYLLRAGDYLAAVSRDQVACIEIARFADAEAPIRATPRVVNGAIQGRVVPCDGALAVPSAAGLAFVNPADPSSPTLVPLERAGISMPLGDQVLVVDDGAVHSYLTWEAADGLLAQRMAADPDDPRPAVAATDLAYRGGRHDRISATADLALRAIERAPEIAVNVSARARLFDSLFEMLHAADPAAPAPAPGTAQPPPLPASVREEVVARLTRAAATPEQRVASAFTVGRLREDQRRAADAVEAYQGVLDDAALADTLWAGSTHTVRAHAEATRRLWDLVRREGARTYAVYDARAAAEAQALGPMPPVEALESIARRYPAAVVTPGLWLRAADAHEVAGAARGAIAALYAALGSAEMLAAGRPLPPPPELGEAAGRLVRTLERADRVAAAGQVLTSIRSRHPALSLTYRGAPIDASSLATELAARLAAVSRYPRIGAAVRGDAQSIEGWTLMTPLSRPSTWLARDHVMMVSQARQQVALWGQNGGLWDEQSGPDRLQLLWSRPFREKPPYLVRSDPDSIFLFWSTPGGAALERIDAIGGKTRWETAPFLSLFPADPAFEQRLVDAGGNAIRFDTPIEGQVRMDFMKVAVDGEVAALVERSGRIALFDAVTGRLLRAWIAPIGAVIDIDVAGGRLVVSGIAQTPGHDALAATPVTLCYDARTGAQLRRIEPPTGDVRWVRLADAGRVVVAYEGGITCTSIATGEQLWTMSARGTAGSLDAWTFGERLFILNGDRQLFHGSLADGSIASDPIDTRDHLQGPSRINAFRVAAPKTGFVFATTRGAVIVSDEGNVVGMDSVPDDAGMIPPVPAERVLVALEAVDRQADPARPGYALHFLAAADGSLLSTQRLLLWDPPTAVAALDGRIVVTAGNVSTVYPVPTDDSR